ncbi:uncharacterized protein LOC130739992 [Lotus japonicus]|uniref:uncharacterized protein LOC130739992 n=1 Tax=Lotus japonicus TaxID=34305 RepID=UPI00258318A5|nr:uncharacterized protein LOC130739992 [Lotus japonicus]
MSEASGKKDYVKAKVERTPLGVKCMGFKSDEEELSAENYHIGLDQDVVPDAKASVPREDSGVPTKSHGSSSPSKEDELVHVSTDDSQIKRKRRVPDVEESPAPKKKTKSTPATSRSKQKAVKGKGKQQEVKSKSVKKKKVPVAAEESGSDVEADVEDILPYEKKYAGKHIPQNVPVVPIDNVSFHAEGNVQKWKYVCQRRFAKERDVGSDVLEYKEVVALIEKDGLMKIILKVGRCYERLVKEFLVNLSMEVGLPESVEFRKVFVRAKCVEFSPAVSNQALGRSVVDFVDEELSLDVVAKDISACQVKKWPIKKLLSTGNLSVKYAIHNRIGVVNWVPTQHTSGVSTTLAKLIYKIGTSTHPQIIRADEVAMPKGVPISLDHRLFMDRHVPNIVVPFSRTSVPAYVSDSGTKAIIAELMDVSKVLQETIKISTARKIKVDALLLKLQEEEGQEGEPSGAATAPQDAGTEEEGESESIEETEGESSSED